MLNETFLKKVDSAKGNLRRLLGQNKETGWRTPFVINRGVDAGDIAKIRNYATLAGFAEVADDDIRHNVLSDGRKLTRAIAQGLIASESAKAEDRADFIRLAAKAYDKVESMIISTDPWDFLTASNFTAGKPAWSTCYSFFHENAHMPTLWALTTDAAVVLSLNAEGRKVSRAFGFFNVSGDPADYDQGFLLFNNYGAGYSKKEARRSIAKLFNWPSKDELIERLVAEGADRETITPLCTDPDMLAFKQYVELTGIHGNLWVDGCCGAVRLRPKVRNEAGEIKKSPDQFKTASVGKKFSDRIGDASESLICPVCGDEYSAEVGVSGCSMVCEKKLVAMASEHFKANFGERSWNPEPDYDNEEE